MADVTLSNITEDDVDVVSPENVSEETILRVGRSILNDIDDRIDAQFMSEPSVEVTVQTHDFDRRFYRLVD